MTFLSDKLMIERACFNRSSFFDYLPEFGGHISDYATAIKIFGVRDWLQLFIPVSSEHFTADYKYIQQILFPLPIKIIDNISLLTEFLELCHFGAYRGLKYYFNGINMEFHHINMDEDKLVYVPKDFHKGFHYLLHSELKTKGGLKIHERKNYKSNRNRFLKFIGDAFLYVSMIKHQECKRKYNEIYVSNPTIKTYELLKEIQLAQELKPIIKNLYFTDPKLELFTYEYNRFTSHNCNIYQFTYYDNGF
jgi:hypothetical protein